MEVILKKTEKKFGFESVNEDSIVQVCASPELEQGNVGFRPMELILQGLAGCMAIDVLLILDKQKQRVDQFEVKVVGERNPEPPKEFTAINLHINASGNIEDSKLSRAIDLAKEKYCSVYHSLNDKIIFTTSYKLKRDA